MANEKSLPATDERPVDEAQKTTREKKTVAVETHERKEGSKADLDERLDEALEESFPGSDPVSISQPTGPAPKK